MSALCKQVHVTNFVMKSNVPIDNGILYAGIEINTSPVVRG